MFSWFDICADDPSRVIVVVTPSEVRSNQVRIGKRFLAALVDSCVEALCSNVDG